MANEHVNKVIYGGNTLIDLTADTVAASDILSGKTAHDKSGAIITGTIASKATATYTPTTTDQTIAAGQYLSGNQIVKGDASLVASNIAAGQTIFNIEGSFSADGTAIAGDILAGKTAYVNGLKVTGSMVNRGAVAGIISGKSSEYTVPIGFHDGSGKVSIAPAEQDKIIATNIKQGVTILGVLGTYSGEAITTTTLNVTPYTTAKTYQTPVGYDYISEVSVAAIEYTETVNTAGGKTVTIGTVDPA